jgi:co-chaperonin GroES (HSP10)
MYKPDYKVSKVAGYRILVQPDKFEEKTTKSGIVIDVANDRRLKELAACRGVVLAIGEFAFMDFPEKWCEVGDYITYTQYSGTFLDSKMTESPIFVNDVDVLAILKKDNVE